MNGTSRQFEEEYRRFVLQKLRKLNRITRSAELGEASCVEFYCDFCTPTLALCAVGTGRFDYFGLEDSYLWLSIFDLTVKQQYLTLRRRVKVRLLSRDKKIVLYRCTYVPKKKKFPANLICHLASNGLILGQNTSEQRLICALKFDIKGREVHHINYNPFDNRLSNLLPMKKIDHTKCFHYEPNTSCLSPTNIDKGERLLVQQLETMPTTEGKRKNTKYQGVENTIKLLQLNQKEKLSTKKLLKCRKTYEKKYDVIIPSKTKLEGIFAAYRRLFDLDEFEIYFRANSLE